MKAIEHKVKLIYQPTSNTCGYTALSILLSHYRVNIKPLDLVKKVPQPKNENGKPVGSVTAHLVTWLLQEGWAIDFYAFDCQVLDLSWDGLNGKELLHKLEKIKGNRNVPGLGEHWTKVYIDSYIHMIEAGGEINIQPHVTSKLLYKLLQKGPVYANYCATTVNGEGRLAYPDPNNRIHVHDDIKGKVSNHSVVIYGNDSVGNFLVADPWHGLRKIDCETMLCGITAAQIECDNQCFQLQIRR